MTRRPGKSKRPTPANIPAVRARATPQPFLLSRWASFCAALGGVLYLLRTQPNVWIELAAAATVAVAGWWLHIDPLEWALLGLTVALVLALEAINSAIEAVIDLVSPDYHPLARVAKDCAAGALIFAVLGSLAVAGAVFGVRLWAWFFGG